MGLSGVERMTDGLTLGSSESILIVRAADFLAGGPADAQSLISYVCQLPGAPLTVAEHMAVALFAGQQRFARDTVGRWCLRDADVVAAALAAPPAAGALDHGAYVVVDVETTGTRAYGGDRVTEVAVVQVRDGVATPVFDTLVNPDRPIPGYISQLTNISWEMVKDAPRFGDVCEQLLGVLEGHVFVAHNVLFDWRFISMEVERATGRPLRGRRLCTVRMARKLLPQLRRRNLDSVTAHYGIDIGARHRAGGDALATAHVLLRLIAEAKQAGCATLDDVDRLLAGGTSRKRRGRPPGMPQPVSEDTTA